MWNFKQIILVLVLSLQFSNAQTIDPDKFLVPKGNDSLPMIFLVGSFHFEYYNLDAQKIEKDKQIDVMSEARQKEIKQLLDYISIFKPTKICIEAPEKWQAMKRYRAYKSGQKKLERDEVQQIGFRLVERFNLDTMYGVDSKTIIEELSTAKDSTILKPYIDSIFNNYAFKPNDNYIKFFEYEAEQTLKLTLLEYFKYMNSPKRLERDYGAYLLGDFKNGKYAGADALATYWYDRNLRIFRNIQRMTTSPKDRILVLFGAGHIAVLDQLLKCSPEYNYIRFNDLKK